MRSIKHLLRQRMRETRLHLPENLRRYWGGRVCARLFQSAVFRSAHTIAVYQSSFGEVPTALILEYSERHHKSCYLPILHNNTLVFVRWNRAHTLQPNRFGILEPPWDPQHVLPAAAFDLVLVPLVAFDPRGSRLGMGGGFYDRTFAFKRKQRHSPSLIGLAYDFQCVPRVPHSAWDIPLNGVMTPEKEYVF